MSNSDQSVNPLGVLVLATARGERSGPLKPNEQRAVAKQVAEAIHAAKERVRERK